MISFVSALAYHASVHPYLHKEHKGKDTYLTLRLRVHSSLNASKVFVRSAPEGEELANEAHLLDTETAEKLNGAPIHKDWLWWEAVVPVCVPHFSYRFYILTPQGNYNVNAKGVVRYTPLDRDDFKFNLFHNPPEWVKDAIFYQIFPDRFYCGDPSTNVKEGEYTLAGEKVSVASWDDPEGVNRGNGVFYGGDIPGIIEKLPYIEDLGANAIYLNPIFKAPSNHKYDVADYKSIDPHLGGEEALKRLRAETRAKNMHLVLDIVPNHCGECHYWFLKARADKDSKEYNYFTFYDDDIDNYEMWLGVRTLPRLNYRCADLRQEMYEGQDSIMRYWLREPYAIDGWRLDVANMLARQNFSQLAHDVGRGMRHAVKEENPQAWLLAENFFDFTEYQQGDEFDAAMNYRAFTFPLMQWMVGRDFEGFKGTLRGDTGFLPTEDFIEQLQNFRAAIPESTSLNMFNMLDSHDVPRAKTMAYGRVDKLKAMLAFMFAYQGAPCIYYGDEIGMEGGKDPDCRRPMIWDESQWDKELREYVKKLCSLRKKISALRHGDLQWIQATYNSLAFVRNDGHSRAILAITRDCERENPPVSGEFPMEFAPLDVISAAIAEGTKFVGAISGREAYVLGGLICLSPMTTGAEIWIEQR